VVPAGYRIKLEVAREGVEDLSPVAGLAEDALYALDLSGTRFGDDDLTCLRGLRGLRELDLSWMSRLTDAGLEHIGTLTRLRVLNLANNYERITGKGLVYLAGLSDLEELVLSDSHVENATIANLRAFKKLRRLNLSEACVSDVAMPHIGALRSLHELDLEMLIRLTDVGLGPLTALVHLRYLILSHTRISDAGLEAIGRLRSLRTLILSNTNISDAGIAHLRSLTKLECLSLQRTHVSDDGLLHLAALTSLRSLKLGGTRVTASGAETLKASLPSCYVTLEEIGVYRPPGDSSVR